MDVQKIICERVKRETLHTYSGMEGLNLETYHFGEFYIKVSQGSSASIHTVYLSNGVMVTKFVENKQELEKALAFKVDSCIGAFLGVA